MVNNNTAHIEVVHKYLLKVFYNKTNKKEYKLQICQHNVWYTNIIAMKDIVILGKAGKKEELLEDIADIISLTKITQVISLVNFALKYKWVISNSNLKIVKELGLTGVNKY